MVKCKYCGVPAESKQQLAFHVEMVHAQKKDTRSPTEKFIDSEVKRDNYGVQIELQGQIMALLKVEMHVTAERMMLEAELAKLKEENE